MSWKYFENGFEEEKSFVGDTIALVAFIFLKRMETLYPLYKSFLLYTTNTFGKVLIKHKPIKY
jgi:hypothetical protein